MPVKRRKFTHLSLADRKAIQKELKTKEPKLRRLAETLGCSASTVSLEVKRHRHFVSGPEKGNFVEEVSFSDSSICLRLQSWPFTCQGCNRQVQCRAAYRMCYQATRAQKKAEQVCCESRRGTHIEWSLFLDIQSDLLDYFARGCSPYICSIALEEKYGISRSTIYSWCKKGYGELSILHLPRAAHFRVRKSDKNKRAPSVVDDSRCFEAYLSLSEEERSRAPQIDTVEGRKTDKKCLLSILFKPAHFQLYLPLENKTQRAIEAEFDCLEHLLGAKLFRDVFHCSLTDRGDEFKDVEALEKSKIDKRKRRMHIFYTDPQQSSQKGACENNHREMRGVFPKAFKQRPARTMRFITRKDCARLMSHVNSKPRESLGGKTPYEILQFIYPELHAQLCDGYGIEKISLYEVNLSPSLIDSSWE